MKLCSLFILFLSISGIAFSMDHEDNLSQMYIKSHSKFVCQNGNVIADIRTLIPNAQVEQEQILMTQTANLEAAFKNYQCSETDQKRLVARLNNFNANKKHAEYLNFWLNAKLNRDKHVEVKRNAKRKLF